MVVIVQLLNHDQLVQFSSVHLLSHVWLFATPWIAARQASLSITKSRSLLKPMPIESVMPSSHLILCHPLLLLPPIPPSIRVFSNGQLFAWGGQSTGVSASASVLPMNTQDWSCSPRDSKCRQIAPEQGREIEVKAPCMAGSSGGCFDWK